MSGETGDTKNKTIITLPSVSHDKACAALNLQFNSEGRGEARAPGVRMDLPGADRSLREEASGGRQPDCRSKTSRSFQTEQGRERLAPALQVCPFNNKYSRAG